jgi:transcriptional regulator with XRE-family HTH domain
MGRGRRLQPRKLKNKLHRIRSVLGLTQEEMAKQLSSYAPKVAVYPGHISQFESGQREPQLPILLAYAKMVGISTDVLIDDDIDLPEKLPSKPKHKVVMRKNR